MDKRTYKMDERLENFTGNDFQTSNAHPEKVNRLTWTLS